MRFLYGALEKKISSVSCWGVFMTIKTSGLLSGLQFHIKTMDTDQSSVTNSISVWNIISVARFIILQFFAENLFGNQPKLETLDFSIIVYFAVGCFYDTD